MSTEWLYGINAVEGQLQAEPESVLELWVESGARNPRLDRMVSLGGKHQLRVQRASASELSHKVGSDRHQGIALRYRVPEPLSESDLPALAEAADGKALFLILDGVTDPHNLGACIRSAAAAGATAVVFPKDKSAGLTAVAHRASAGTAARMPIAQVTNLARALELLKESGVWCYGAAGEATGTLYQTDLRGSVALVLGSEGEGLRRLTRERCDGLLRIPMAEGIESLNVSVAAGVMLFEAVRQRLS